LPDHHPGRTGAFGYLCGRGVSVRDRIGALGGGVRFLLAETDTEPGSCGASHDPGCAREEEDQVAARGVVDRTALRLDWQPFRLPRAWPLDGDSVPQARRTAT